MQVTGGGDGASCVSFMTARSTKAAQRNTCYDETNRSYGVDHELIF